MRRGFVIGGLIAGVILIALGVGEIVVGAAGRDEVRDRIADERIVGTPDMTLRRPRPRSRRQVSPTW